MTSPIASEQTVSEATVTHAPARPRQLDLLYSETETQLRAAG